MFTITGKTWVIGIVLMFIGAPRGEAAFPSPAERGLPRHRGLTPGSQVRVTLRSGVSLSGRVLQMTDSTVVLSSADVPLELLQSHSVPLRVSDETVVIWQTDGTRLSGKIVQVTESHVYMWRQDVRVMMAREKIVAVARKGRQARDVQVTLHWAELETELPPGIRVRVQAPAVTTSRLVGTVVAVDTARIVLQVQGTPAHQDSLNGARQPIAIPLADVWRLEVSRGRKTTGTKILKGAGIGTLAGASAGFIAGVIVWQANKNEELAALGMLFFPMISAPAGLVAGTLIGAIPHEQWEAVPLPLSQHRIGILPQGEAQNRRDRLTQWPPRARARRRMTTSLALGYARGTGIDVVGQGSLGGRVTLLTEMAPRTSGGGELGYYVLGSETSRTSYDYLGDRIVHTFTQDQRLWQVTGAIRIRSLTGGYLIGGGGLYLLRGSSRSREERRDGVFRHDFHETSFRPGFNLGAGRVVKLQESRSTARSASMGIEGRVHGFPWGVLFTIMMGITFEG